MVRQRFLDFRNAYQATPWSAPVGLCTGDLPTLAALVNLCQERLITDPMSPDEGWWGSWARMAFTVSRTSPFIIAPRDVARIILLDVCKRPVFIRNEFWEFLEFGRGFQPPGCPANTNCGSVMTTYEREIVPTLQPFLGNQTIRIFPVDPRDVGKTVILQGQDINGKTVTSTDATTGSTVLGETVTLAQPFVDSANVYSTVTGIQKNVTFGTVEFQQVDPNTMTASGLSEMQPNETTGYYRKYFVNNLPKNCCNTPGGTIQVLAMCKLDLVPVVADQDYLLIQSVPALLEEAQCIRLSSMENKTSLELAKAHHVTALQILAGQLDHFLGQTRTAIRMPLFGSNRLRPQPI